MLLHLINWLLSYTDVIVSGQEILRLVNLMAASGLSYRILAKKEESVTLRVRYSSLERFILLTERCKVSCEYSGIVGLRHYTHYLAERPGIAIGLFLGVAVAFFLSGRVWVIEVADSAKYSQQEIISAAGECGVGIGKNYNGNASLKLLSRLPKLDWISVNRNGVFVSIVLRDGIEKPDIEDKNRVCNIIASEGGRIISARAEKGKLMCKVGSGVAKGDLLISGVWKNEKGNTFRSLSRGTVCAETRHSFFAYIPLRKECMSGAESLYRKQLDFFSLSIPLGFASPEKNESYEFSQHKENLRLCGVSLPISVTTQRFVKLEKRELSYSRALAEKMALTELEESLSKYLGEEGVLMLKNEEIFESESFVYIKWDCLCRINIAKEQTVFVK